MVVFGYIVSMFVLVGKFCDCFIDVVFGSGMINFCGKRYMCFFVFLFVLMILNLCLVGEY